MSSGNRVIWHKGDDPKASFPVTPTAKVVKTTKKKGATTKKKAATTKAPAQMDYYRFKKAEWRANRPTNWPVTPPGATSTWPPNTVADLLVADTPEGDPSRPLCIGPLLWQRIDCGDVQNCRHTFWEWIQGGIDWESRFELRESPIAGIGVWTKVRWENNDILGCYTGTVVPPQFSDREAATRADGGSKYIVKMAIGPKPPRLQVRHSAAWPKADIDAEWFGNWTRFANHSCNSNAKFVPRRVGNHLVMVVQAKKRIPVGAEITVAYGKEYLDAMGTLCLCGHKDCKDRAKHKVIKAAADAKAAKAVSRVAKAATRRRR
ncbi:SET domain-containing protein [Lophium mytilinum]|uniref:SET domain-containing protein n=1 Tax=Lophium mytilinum TaxID=390894 RepID=A0A6A6R1T2_9PEZI|nr:SET domain-containing protein [Lophium mytilinum]